MIRAYACGENALSLADRSAIDDGWIWLDLFNPTPEEEQLLESRLGIDIPTQEEMREIEVSSRLYREDGGYFMTATVLTRVEVGDTETDELTFVLVKGRLITVRYIALKPLDEFVLRASKPQCGINQGVDTMIGLLDSMINRAADALELVAKHIDTTSKIVLNPAETSANRDYKNHIRRIGQMADLASRCSESLVSMERVATFLALAIEEQKLGKETRGRARAAVRDAQSLVQHASFLSDKLSFLLEATLGMIGIEQNTIIKIFSVAAVVFLPPTLIASIYGMNFEFMPELHWRFGYPLAMVMMVISALVPLWWFKKRGWL
jgi:magnesium transporter